MHKITMTAETAWIKTERTTDRTGQKLSEAQIEKEKASPLMGSVAVSLYSNLGGALMQVKLPVFKGRYGLNIGDPQSGASIGETFVEAAKELALRAWKSGKEEKVEL